MDNMDKDLVLYERAHTTPGQRTYKDLQHSRRTRKNSITAKKVHIMPLTGRWLASRKESNSQLVHTAPPP